MISSATGSEAWPVGNTSYFNPVRNLPQRQSWFAPVVADQLSTALSLQYRSMRSLET